MARDDPGSTQEKARARILVSFLSDLENNSEDRVDAAASLMRLDPQLAEVAIVNVLKASPADAFDFRSELLDVLLGAWAGHNRNRDAEALFRILPDDEKDYALQAWNNLIGLKNRV